MEELTLQALSSLNMEATASSRISLAVPKLHALQDILSDVGQVTFTVKDTGVGICPEDAGKLFTAYGQINPSELQQGGGAGLGLSLSKAIIEQMGGKIRVNSTPNVGTEFIFEIPFPGHNPLEKDENIPNIEQRRDLHLDIERSVEVDLHEEVKPTLCHDAASCVDMTPSHPNKLKTSCEVGSNESLEDTFRYA
ncbi:hypothetical protein CYMTET_32683 [Cymbomonas tetramitiformis]|uniref:histidine kinase n=1 Tax=Cymbomonas tetramitiformis TaxID=36881 RepID=A0AAE0FEK7_9CHLO|nr:hypothetical protein CYMTET_55661 [Cymbomonas tetramitiformis]KAK3258265.1 hypothetical protein CYMTET_32683 [Cymbomonas tetramitiformis]